MSTTTICMPYINLHCLHAINTFPNNVSYSKRDLESRADFQINMRCLQLARTRDAIQDTNWQWKELNPIFVSLLVASLHDGTENPRSHRTVKVLWSDTGTESRWTVLREENTYPLCIHVYLPHLLNTFSMQVVPARRTSLSRRFRVAWDAKLACILKTPSSLVLENTVFLLLL